MVGYYSNGANPNIKYNDRYMKVIKITALILCLVTSSLVYSKAANTHEKIFDNGMNFSNGIQENLNIALQYEDEF